MAWSRTQASPEVCSPSRAAEPLGPAVPRARAADGRLPLGLLLCGGTANRGRVVRVGDTVVRPAAPCRPATHALLRHLAAAGFDGAPRVLAAGPVPETRPYIGGRPAAPPLAEDMLSDDALASVADLLRRFH